MWKLDEKYKECCHNDACESFDTCIECWDEWAENNPPMTNADRIRAMSDEELAKFLDDCNSQGCVCPTRDCSEVCELCIAEWLKEPVKEDA